VVVHCLSLAGVSNFDQQGGGFDGGVAVDHTMGAVHLDSSCGSVGEE